MICPNNKAYLLRLLRSFYFAFYQKFYKDGTFGKTLSSSIIAIMLMGPSAIKSSISILSTISTGPQFICSTSYSLNNPKWGAIQEKNHFKLKKKIALYKTGSCNAGKEAFLELSLFHGCFYFCLHVSMCFHRYCQ